MTRATTDSTLPPRLETLARWHRALLMTGAMLGLTLFLLALAEAARVDGKLDPGFELD